MNCRWSEKTDKKSAFRQKSIHAIRRGVSITQISKFANERPPIHVPLWNVADCVTVFFNAIRQFLDMQSANENDLP